MTGTLYFSVSAALADRLGDEMIKDPQTAFFELIKNSYDADGTEVLVSFHKSTTGEGTITIRDNGAGMTVEDLEEKWLRAAGESKVRNPLTPKFGRRCLGAKGIGRFSAKKLGNVLKIRSVPSGSREQLVFRLDFKRFTDDLDLNQIPIEFRMGSPRAGFTGGMILEISELVAPWGRSQIRKVRSQLCSLIDPESEDQDFSICFECPEFPDLSGPLENPIGGQETHRLRFAIDVDGSYERELTAETTTKTTEQRKPLPCGAVRGVIRYYRQGLKKQDRQLLGHSDESHMGVKVYRDNCRVRPYGEDGDDWLQVKRNRATGGGKYLVNYRSLAGSAYISATDNPELRDASDRESGMLDNPEFEAFQSFVREQVDHLNHILEQEARSEVQRQKRETLKRVLDKVIDCLNREESEVYGRFISKIDRGRKGEFGGTTKKKSDTVRDVKKPTKREWQCNSCGEVWRALMESVPTECMESAVDRHGTLREVEGCGSTDIDRSRHQPKGGEARLPGIVSGEYALVDGREIRVLLDPNMGPNEEEYDWEGRMLSINMNHPAFRLAETLDRGTGRMAGSGEDSVWPAQTIHVAKCVCLGWAWLHFDETGRWEEFESKYEHLQASLIETLSAELAV